MTETGLKVAVVCPYDVGAAGGVQQLTTELARRLSQAGDSVVLVAPGRPVTELTPGVTVEAVGRPTVVEANESAVPVSFDPRAIGSARRIFERADVVHVHEPFVPLVGWTALRCGKPVVATFHADPAPWTRSLYRRVAPVGKAWLGSAHLTAVSPVAASALPASWGSPEIVPNAIDVASYDVDTQRRANRVVFLGRDDPRKGLDVLLEAWSLVRDSQPDAELVVVGATRAGPPPGVEMAGRVDEHAKRQLLASSSVFVAPNLGSESFGIVVAEGMAAGCAVVASDIPAFRPVLDGAGTLTTPGDARSVADAIVAYLRDPIARERHGTEARRSVGRFDWSHVVTGYRAAYESALRRSGSTIES